MSGSIRFIHDLIVASRVRRGERLANGHDARYQTFLADNALQIFAAISLIVSGSGSMAQDNVFNGDAHYCADVVRDHQQCIWIVDAYNCYENPELHYIVPLCNRWFPHVKNSCRIWVWEGRVYGDVQGLDISILGGVVDSKSYKCIERIQDSSSK